MKGFIKKIIVFLSLAIFTIIIIVTSTHYIVKTKSTFKIDDELTRVVIGHSHSQCSLNDSILNNSINLSASGESYFYNYHKLRKIIEENSHIKTVFIEFANNHVDSIMDEWTWGYEKMSYYVQFYSPFMEAEDIKVLYEHNSTDLFASFSIATRKHLYRIMRGDYDLVNDIGSFTGLKGSKVNEMIANNNFNSSISTTHSISETNIYYLQKMINLCQVNSIKVFLIRSPQHPLYADLSNEPIYQKVLQNQLLDVELLDFDAMYFPNNYYLDLHHLNYKGANEFTQLFNTLIENNLLITVDKQDIINAAIKDYNDKWN